MTLRQDRAGDVTSVLTLTFATIAKACQITHISLLLLLSVMLKTRKLGNSGCYRSDSLFFYSASGIDQVYVCGVGLSKEL
jgi:hypothetical protein